MKHYFRPVYRYFVLFSKSNNPSHIKASFLFFVYTENNPHLNFRMFRTQRALQSIKKSNAKVPTNLAGNKLVVNAIKNPFDDVNRCKLCGTGISYKNAQLISQFVSPYTGKYYFSCYKSPFFIKTFR